jgi:hypothetical protein
VNPARVHRAVVLGGLLALDRWQAQLATTSNQRALAAAGANDSPGSL